MVGAMIADAVVLGNPLFSIIPCALLALVLITAFRDPSLDDTIATLQRRRRVRDEGRGARGAGRG
jgi:hypothetical protein